MKRRGETKTDVDLLNSENHAKQQEPEIRNQVVEHHDNKISNQRKQK